MYNVVNDNLIKMDTQELRNKFNELQKYIPFLEKVMLKLQHGRRDEKDADASRSNHLQKVKMLHDLLTKESKKLTLDALHKCEEVLLKLYCKMEQDGVSETIVLDDIDKDKSANEPTRHAEKSEKAILSVPESPPPDDGSDDCVFVPVNIPTERCVTPNEKKFHRKHKSHSHRSEKPRHDRREHRKDHKHNYDIKSYESRDKFERQRHDRDRFDRESNYRNERERSDRDRQAFGTQKIHNRNYHSYERLHHDRDKTLERSKSKENDDHCKGVFSRLGDKLPDEEHNILAKAAEGLKRTITQNVTVTSFADGNKSITKERHDSNSLNKDFDTRSSLNKMDLAYGIGERRTPKSENKEMSKLDEVRKKLSLISKCSSDTNRKNSPVSQMGHEHFNKSENVIIQDPRLKNNYYGPVPQSMNAAAVGNMFPSVNRMDPRLRKNSNSSSCSSTSHSYITDTKKNVGPDRAPNTNFIKASSHSDHQINRNSYINNPSYSTKKHSHTPEEIWDTGNHSSIKKTQSNDIRMSWSQRQSQGARQNLNPRPLSPTENWDDQDNSSDKSSGHYPRVHSRNQVKNFGNHPQNNWSSAPQCPNNDKEWNNTKKISPIPPSKNVGINAQPSGSLYKCNTIPHGSSHKNNPDLNQRACESEENWDEIDYHGNLSSYELNRRRILALEEEEKRSSNFAKVADNTNWNDTDKLVEDDFPTTSRFNALLNDKSERVHYMESKKHKEKHDPNCSSTYAEYKRKKALLEEKKRKMLAEANRKREENSLENEQKKINSRNEIPFNDSQNKIAHTKQSTIENGKNEPIKNNNTEHKKTELCDKKESGKSHKTYNNKTCSAEFSENNVLNSEKSKTKSKCEKKIDSNVKNSEINESGSELNRPNMEKSSRQKPPKEPDNTATLKKITKEDVSKLPNFLDSQIPRKRSNSMCVYESKSLVEKDKLKFANTILYADLQCEARPSHKINPTIEKISNRNSESLASIFKKTDDNCTVSTQNIISGKRRTRTTVNFNEVQQAQTVFKHMRKSTGTHSKQSQKKEKKDNADEVQQIDEATSSSVKSSDTSQENGNQEVLEGFVQDMLKPNANTEYILGLLGKILPEEKLNLVRTIIKSAQTADNIDINSKSKDNQSEFENNENKDSIENESDQESPRKRFKKRSELDRLNEDIRDMFISEGVLTATGKRMCKLVNEKNSHELKATPPTTDKYEKILKRQCTIKIAKLKLPTDHSPKVRKGASPLPSNASEKESISKSSLSEKNESEVNQAVLTKKEEKKNVNNKGTLKKEMKNSLESGNFDKSKMDKKPNAKTKFSRKAILKKDGIRNTNINHHFLSKYASETCIVCNRKLAHLSFHYQTCHAESYRSRLAPSIVKKLKAGVLGVVPFIKKTNGKNILCFRCPICFEFSGRLYNDWMEHMRTHTCEYYFNCSYCQKGFNKKKASESHFATHCPFGELVTNFPNPVSKIIKAYLCHLCNFVQFDPNNVLRHYVEQHEIDKKLVKISDLEIIIMDFTSSKIVSEKRAAILERKAQKESFRSLSDDLEHSEIDETSLDNDKGFENIEKDHISAKSEAATDVKSMETEKQNLENEKNTDTELKNTEEAKESVKTPSNKKIGKNAKFQQSEKIVLKHPKVDPNTSNVFLPTPRDTESPTIAFTEKLKTIEKESNQESRTVDKSDQHESMAEKLSQRLKRFNSETEDIKAQTKSEEINIESPHPGEPKNDITDDDDCWIDIEPVEIDSQSKQQDKTVDKSKMKTNKKLHRFYASNANRARKIKGSYLNIKRPNSSAFNKVKSLGNDGDETVYNVHVSNELNSKTSESEATLKNICRANETLKTDQSVAIENSNSQNDSSGQIDRKSNVNNVWNVGYSTESSGVYKFYCLSKECTFLYSNEAVGLENHYLLDHSNLNWNGFCTICDKVVDYGPLLTVSIEIKHMMDKHVKPKNVENLEVVHQEKEESRPPRIKIRRLSGDCLSMSAKPSTEKDITFAESSTQPTQMNFTQGLESVLPVMSGPDITHTPLTSSLGLQITNVCSLNQNSLDVCLPKISNVCSLNPASTFNPSNNENLSCVTIPTEFNRSPEPIVVAETVPVSKSKAGNFLITQTLSTHYGVDGEQSSSPNMGLHIAVSNNTSSTIGSQELNIPMLNMDTVTSVASSNTLNTSISIPSQHNNDQHPYRCMAKNCKFSTRVSVSMLDHLHFHELRCFETERDFLRCNHCEYVAQDKVSLLQHIELEHLSKHKQSSLMGISITAIKSKINDKHKEKTKMTETQFNALRDAIKGLTSHTGRKADDLYRCAISNCKAELNAGIFAYHMQRHAMESRQPVFKCSFCNIAFRNVTALQKHLESFGIHHFFCYTCSHITDEVTEMINHYRCQHVIVKIVRFELILALAKTETSDGINHSYFVAHSCDITFAEVEQFKEKLITEWQTKKNSSKLVYHYNEANLLPIQPIFRSEIHCADCSYKTKVRTNMLRHLSLHQAGLVIEAECDGRLDPVNPMPCLNSNEKHFDKMTNLASSSLVPPAASTGSALIETSGSLTVDTSALKVPYEYVPINRAYTCGILDCQYLTLREDIFRSHVITLHGDAATYSCPFCREEICKRGIIMDRIVNHIRFHGQFLYQCEKCNYLHYVKSVVRRHIQEKHTNVDHVNLVAYDRGSETGGVMTVTQISTTGKSQPPKKAPKNAVPSLPLLVNPNTQIQQRIGASAWKCDLCGLFTKTHNQMLSHCNNVHQCRYRFKCSLCGFGGTKETQVLNHISMSHESNIECNAQVMFHKEDNVEVITADLNEPKSVVQATLNTKPLWQRDDPKRVRHIRGILMEDEEETEQHRKRLRLDDLTEYDDEDMVVSS